MRVEEGKALIQDFFSLVRWVSFSIPMKTEGYYLCVFVPFFCRVSFSIPKRAEGRSFVVIGVPSCMPGIVFNTQREQ